jgi:hypothetical protein
MGWFCSARGTGISAGGRAAARSVRVTPRKSTVGTDAAMLL